MVGNYKLKLSDMIPSAWLFKFVHMSKGSRSLANSNTNHSRKGIRKASSASTQPQPSKTKQPHQSNPRESYYFTRKLIPGDEKPKVSQSDCYTTYVTPSPTKSSQQRLRRPSTITPPSTTNLAGSSVSPGCNCRVKLESVWTQSESPFEYSSYPLDACPEIRTDRLLPTESSDEMFSWCSSCGYGVSSGARDIVMDVDRNSLDVQCDKLDDYDKLSELELPPIVTKPAKFSDMVIDIKKETKTKTNSSRSVNYEETRKQRCLRVKIAKEEMTSIKEQRDIAGRRLSVSSPGVRLRTKSPKISNSKVQALMSRKRVLSSTRRNRSLSDSYAVVKSSSDPERDFRDSMVEMIVENKIRGSKDLEDLLACYLSLNSDEYHDLIVKVFKQLWFDLVDTR